MWFRDPRFWSLFSLFVIVSCAIVLILRPVAHAGPAGAKRNADGTYGKDHFDPIKKNGEIFKDWPKPKAVLLFSSEQDGYIEPCGCAGLENQKGGMSRRHDLIKQLQASSGQWLRSMVVDSSKVSANKPSKNIPPQLIVSRR